MKEQTSEIRLSRRDGQVYVRFKCKDDLIPVKLVWARPISARGGEISLVDKDKSEVHMLDSLTDLDPESRMIAEEELDTRYLVPRITRVVRADASFGVRYWHVETNLGPRRFALKNAAKNAVWLDSEHLILQDTLGCRYEVKPFSELDTKSKAEVEKVI